MLHLSCKMIFKVIIQESFHQLHSKGDFFIYFCLCVNELCNITTCLLHMALPCMYLHPVSNVTSSPIDIHIVPANQPLHHVLYLCDHQTYFSNHIVFFKELDIISKLLQSQVHFVLHLPYNLNQLLALGICMAYPTKMILILPTKLYIIKPIHQLFLQIYNGWAFLISLLKHLGHFCCNLIYPFFYSC